MILVAFVVIGFAFPTSAYFLGHCLLETHTVRVATDLAYSLWFLVVAVCQYLAVVHRSRYATIVLTTQLIVMGIVVLVVCVLNFANGWTDLDGELIVTFSIGLASSAFGLLTFVWLQGLRRAWKQGAMVTKIHRYALIHMIALVIICAGYVGIAAFHIRANTKERAIGINREEAPVTLPIDASDVSYQTIGPNYVDCDFATSESAFREWFHAGMPDKLKPTSNISLVEINDTVKVARYYTNAPPAPIGKPRSPGRGYGRRQQEVFNGLHAQWRIGNNQYEVTFDRLAGRGFYRRQTARD